MSKYDDVMKLALERGFFFQSSEIYADAPAGFWEYGPLGTSMKNKLIQLWRKELVKRDEMLEIDGSVIMPEDVFIASGHLKSFVDPLVECKKCKQVFRADKIISEKSGQIVPERLSEKEFDALISKYNVRCPNCKGELSKTKIFNMMFKVGIGAKDEKVAYLRPETCQSIFVDFPRVFRTMRCKLPIAIAQTGRVFRNEISPRQCLLRLREIIQAEIEVFFNPSKANEFEKFESVKKYKLRMWIDEKIVEISCEDAVSKGIISNKLIAYYLAILQQFYEKTGIKRENMRFRTLGEDEKAFYTKQGLDFEVLTSVGWIELVACNYRTDYDLSGHAKESKKDFSVIDDGEKIIPHVFELSMGIDRTLFCIMENSFEREKERDVLKVPFYLAPITCAVFPLVNREGMPEKAREIYEMLRKNFDSFYDDSGSIGRRYRRMDEVGCPFCITIDSQTMKDDTVTIRDRDSMKQVRVKINELNDWIKKMIG
ncbi:MAG: glycine--tRNA ligase [Candidatus Parvarchaeota archaeon]|nr:glycine--tRNA ligase [Candidatus Jingweiarchaeum tengchongense]MCW1297723.1 glycine--tRNA ligase [Candidatus Jingweiarchaeum tengchongense]MCW1299733.1 glycine--tRNA ligase [Candidatus Jingweiarchaeum tengchongense]MCW1304296.1 glycine--tRNA ligase [Candidatus Jingweiarchaeum tengchongense]MCW1305323.1 glycine--tRNA ligase [Candidatus Jingweiarchaeum tengchongense]